MKNLSPWHSDPQFWPKAAREYVFLAAAFNEVGKRLYADDWTGREAMEPLWPHREAWRKYENAKRLAAMPPPPVSLSSYRPGRGPVIHRAAVVKPDPEMIASLEQGHASRVAAEQEANDALLARRYKSASWIADHARNDELPTFGVAAYWEPQPLSAATWNGSHDWALFSECQIKRRVTPQTGAVTFSLFVSREGLDRCLARLAQPQVAGKAGAERLAAAWLREEFTKATTADKPKSAFQVEAKALFDGLSGEAFKRAWGHVTSDFPERRNPGAKTKAESVG